MKKTKKTTKITRWHRSNKREKLNLGKRTKPACMLEVLEWYNREKPKEAERFEEERKRRRKEYEKKYKQRKKRNDS